MPDKTTLLFMLTAFLILFGNVFSVLSIGWRSAGSFAVALSLLIVGYLLALKSVSWMGTKRVGELVRYLRDRFVLILFGSALLAVAMIVVAKYVTIAAMAIVILLLGAMVTSFILLAIFTWVSKNECYRAVILFIVWIGGLIFAFINPEAAMRVSCLLKGVCP